MNKTLKKILSVINIVITSIGIINFGRDLVPGLIKWSEFILNALYFFKSLRDLILYPLIEILSIFNYNLYDWFKTYLFIGILSYNTYNLSYRKICGDFSSSSIIRLLTGPERIRIFLLILYVILFWPIHMISLLQHLYKRGLKRKHNVYTLWSKYIAWVGITIVIIVFLNWTFVTFIEELFNH